MQRTLIQANYSFVVEVTNTQFEHLLYMRIDQYTARPHSQAAQDILARAVNIHLNGLHKRTGLNYGVVADGPRGQIDETVALCRWELS